MLQGQVFYVTGTKSKILIQSRVDEEWKHGIEK
jgi:hypothetical protein